MTSPAGPALVVDEVRDHLAGHALLAGVLEVTELDLAPNLHPPSVVVGPPTMRASTPAGTDGPVLHRLTVYVVVQEDEGAYRSLLDLTQLVVRVLDEPAGITIPEWRPTTFPSGAVELPAYAIDIEVTA